jgi:hypothetical protein
VAKDDRKSSVKGWDKVQTAGGSMPHADQPRKFVFDDEGFAAMEVATEKLRADVANLNKVAAVTRRVKLPKCTACEQDAAGGRYGLHHNKGLCHACFSALVEEDLLKAVRQGKVTKAEVEFAERHGVKVPAEARRALNAQPVSRRVTLSTFEVSQLSARYLSADDASKVYWAEISWWYDGRGIPHVREWLGFVAGESVASIDYDHDRKNRGYTAWLLGKVEHEDKKLQTFDKLESAKSLIAKELSDQANLIGGMLDGLREEAPVQATPVTVDGKVLDFAFDVTIESPEAHIDRVRKELGDAAADELEEFYLRTMLEKDVS